METLDARPRRAVGREWLPVAAGLLALYVPAFYKLAVADWQSEDHSHGPIILVLAVWLVWRNREILFTSHPRQARMTGYAVTIAGLMLYVVGRSQDINVFEVGSLAPVLAGVVLAMRGWSAVRALWFPLFFVLFLVPFPDVYVDALTGPLKRAVSASAEQILYTAGYPVARTGVVLTIGQYQMLVADACSGLNSMFSLFALGLLYLHLARRRGWLHNSIVVASIAPIAFASNVVRVVVLLLITYHFGDAAGQGFLHGAAGIALVLAALAMVVALDAGLMRLLPRARGH